MIEEKETGRKIGDMPIEFVEAMKRTMKECHDYFYPHDVMFQCPMLGERDRNEPYIYTSIAHFQAISELDYSEGGFTLYDHIEGPFHKTKNLEKQG